MSGGSFHVEGKKDDSERYFSIKRKKLCYKYTDVLLQFI